MTHLRLKLRTFFENTKKFLNFKQKRYNKSKQPFSVFFSKQSLPLTNLNFETWRDNHGTLEQKLFFVHLQEKKLVLTKSFFPFFCAKRLCLMFIWRRKPFFLKKNKMIKPRLRNLHKVTFWKIVSSGTLIWDRKSYKSVKTSNFKN